ESIASRLSLVDHEIRRNGNHQASARALQLADDLARDGPPLATKLENIATEIDAALERAARGPSQEAWVRRSLDALHRKHRDVLTELVKFDKRVIEALKAAPPKGCPQPIR